MAEVTDETIGLRLCLICGVVYKDRHTMCPHENVKGRMEGLANFLRFKILRLADG